MQIFNRGTFRSILCLTWYVTSCVGHRSSYLSTSWPRGLYIPMPLANENSRSADHASPAICASGDYWSMLNIQQSCLSRCVETHVLCTTSSAPGGFQTRRQHRRQVTLRVSAGDCTAWPWFQPRVINDHRVGCMVSTERLVWDMHLNSKRAHLRLCISWISIQVGELCVCAFWTTPAG